MQVTFTLQLTIPKVEEGISWGVPFYEYYGVLAGFAAYKNHVSFGFGAAVLQSKDRKMLAKKGYKTGKGTMQIKFDQKVPSTAIKQILKAKAKMNEANRGITPLKLEPVPRACSSLNL